MTGREKFVADLAGRLDEVFRLAPDAQPERRRFEALALAAYDCFAAKGKHFWAATPYADTFDGCLQFAEGDPSLASPELVAAWRAWRSDWPGLLARYPRLALYYAISDFSELQFATGWPNNEEALDDWVQQDSHLPMPLFMRDPSPAETHRRLKALRQQIGGWLYLGAGGVTYASEAEWRRIRDERDAAYASYLTQMGEARARADERRRFVQEVVALARADVGTWATLKHWELEQEAANPAPQGPIKLWEPGQGPIYGTATRLTQEQIEARDKDYPVDPVFRPLLDCVSGSDEVLPVFDIIMAVRIALRAELGLPQSFIAGLLPAPARGIGQPPEG